MQSMTGFARMSGEVPGMGWAWEVRSVNARNLDLRIRLPEGADRLDPLLRAAMKGTIHRGSVSVGLRYTVLDTAGTGPSATSHILNELARVEAEALEQGLTLLPSTAADVLTLSLSGDRKKPDFKWIEEAGGQIPTLISALAEARAAEGVELARMLGDSLTQLSDLVSEAAEIAAARAERLADGLRQRVADLLQSPPDEGRLEQEIAILAVKADVTEELDRLAAHVIAARALLSEKQPVGRKFDFLMQEFNREANTLASKSQDTDLTRIALALKVVIDQMREQVQNVE